MRAAGLAFLLAIFCSELKIDPSHYGFLIGCGVVSIILTLVAARRLQTQDREADPLQL